MIRGSSMLKLTSRFILEVLPYLLSALIAAVLVPGFLYSLITAVVVPGFLYSQIHGTEAMVMPNVPGRGENALELIRWDHAAFAPDQMLLDRPVKAAGDKLTYR
jgi:hypothetical protein